MTCLINCNYLTMKVVTCKFRETIVALKWFIGPFNLKVYRKFLGIQLSIQGKAVFLIRIIFPQLNMKSDTRDFEKIHVKIPFIPNDSWSYETAQYLTRVVFSADFYLLFTLLPVFFLSPHFLCFVFFFFMWAKCLPPKKEEKVCVKAEPPRTQFCVDEEEKKLPKHSDS